MPETTSTPAQPPTTRRTVGALMLATCRHASAWTLRLLVGLVIFLIVFFAYLHLVGLPAYVTDHFLDRMARRGYHLQIERLSLEIDRGLVAGNVRMFAHDNAAEPFLTARELTVALDPGALLRQRKTVPVLGIVDGRLRAQLAQERFGAREGMRSLSAENIHLRFSMADHEVRLREFQTLLLGIRFRGRGVIHLPPPDPDAPPPAPDAPPPPGINPLKLALEHIEQAPDWTLRLVERINAISFNSPPLAEFAFTIHPDRPEANVASLRLDGPDGGVYRDIAFDCFQFNTTWKNQQLHVPELLLCKENDNIGISGWWDVSSMTVSAHLINTLPLGVYISLLPDTLRHTLAGIIEDATFPLRLEMNVGPVPLERAAEEFSGRLVAAQANIKEVPLEHLDLFFARKGQRLMVESGRVQLDSGPLASHLQIHDAEFRLDTLQYSSRLSGSLNPHTLRPVMTPNFRNIVDLFEVREPLEGDVRIGGTLFDPAISCQGPVQATNFVIRGVPVQFMSGDLNITNEVMHLTGCTMIRPEGQARGDVHIAFSNQTLRFDVDSRLAPRAVAQMLGPAVADFMTPFQMEGPAHVQAGGLVDYHNFALNRLNAHVEAKQFGYDRWVADSAVFDLDVVGLRLRFTNVVAQAYGGQLAGHGVCYPVQRDDQWRYEVQLDSSKIQIEKLLGATTGKEPEKLSGGLHGAIRVGGYIGIGTGPSVTGTGQASIKKGHIFQTPLFNGLTSVLGHVFPDFNLFAQTDARGNFAIRNSRVYSDDIELMGTVFSVKASGRYAFDGDLRFRVEVQPLRKGPVATLLRLATRPVTRLLEFRLTGTFDSPKWRPVNLNPADHFN